MTFGLAIMAIAPVAHAGNNWDGGGTPVNGVYNWSDVNNWSSNTAPNYASGLSFLRTIGLNSNNDATSTIAGITFSSSAGAFTLTGQAVTLTGNVNSSASSNLQTLNFNFAMQGTCTFTVSSNSSMVLGGNISETGGAAGLTTTGNGSVTLSGQNSFTGSLTIGGNSTAIVTNLGNTNSTTSNVGTASTIAFGNSSGGGTLRYNGAGENSNRNFSLSNASGLTAGIENNSTTNVLTLTGNITLPLELRQ